MPPIKGRTGVTRTTITGFFDVHVFTIPRKPIKISDLQGVPRTQKVRIGSEWLVHERKYAESLELRDALERELRQKQDSKRKLNEAYIYRSSLSESDYRQMKEALEQEILTLEMKVTEAKQDEIEIEQLLDFSENLLLKERGATAALRRDNVCSRFFSLKE